MIKHIYDITTDIEGPEPSQEEETALAPPVHCFYVGRPLQFIFQHHPQVFAGLSLSLSPPSVQTDWYGVLDLLKSTTSYLVLVVFRSKKLFLVQPQKDSTRSLYSLSCPTRTHATTAVSSDYFSMWQDSELYLKSDVYRVKRKGAKTVPCGAPVLHSSVPETHLPILTYCGLAVK